MEPLTVAVVPSRSGRGPDPVTIGLSMVNWIVLMLLMSGFLLATTTAERSAPAGTSAEIGTTAPR